MEGFGLKAACYGTHEVEEGLHKAQMRPGGVEGVRPMRLRPHFNISEAFARSCHADMKSQIAAPLQSWGLEPMFLDSASRLDLYGGV